jgi:hypothetical protein
LVGPCAPESSSQLLQHLVELLYSVICLIGKASKPSDLGKEMPIECDPLKMIGFFSMASRSMMLSPT